MNQLSLDSCSSAATCAGTRIRGIVAFASTVVALGLAVSARASIAYGTLNNFDCVNDTGVEAHGFEIELDDVHSRDITYTYDYNHYGIPKITEDNTDPLHPKVFIRYAGVRNPDGTWTSYTAIPAGPIAPTQGHQFTDPSINFGGEHFGAGYYGAPSAVKYNWLIDDGTGSLVHGAPVMVSTPIFTYFPPAPAQIFPQVQAVVVPPPPPAPPVMQFGSASWVKDIKTSTHNANKVELVDLRDPDPADPLAKDWANGEPAEVETEWRVLQTEFANAGNPKGELKGRAEDLPGGDEVITRRYEFYKYVGPIDAESGEAMADEVAADGIHGVGTVTYIDSFDAFGEPVEVTVDLSTVTIVGDFFGAQMAGFDIAPALGLIDHIADGEVNIPFAERTVVVGGGAGFLATVSGALPDGTTLDEVTGIFSGTPTVPGVFTFTVSAADLAGTVVSKAYTVTIAGDGVVPASYTITTTESPIAGGATSGGGTFNSGDSVTVVAMANAGYSFAGWTEGGVAVSASPSFTFFADANRSLVAEFTPITYGIITIASPVAGGTTSGGGTFNSGDSVTVVATAKAGYAFAGWTEGGVAVSASASYTLVASANRSLVARFVPITYTISAIASPLVGGTTSGGGTFNSGNSVTVIATAKAGYAFTGWTEGGVGVSGSASYTFVASANRSLVAGFAPITYRISTVASPVAGGMTTGGGSIKSGNSVTVVAIAKAGYAFTGWTEGGVAVSGSASYRFVASANRNLVAGFAPSSATGMIRSVTIASPVDGGNEASGEIQLAATAPVGGATVLLFSSDSRVLTVPVSVFVPAGQKSVSFTARTSTVIQAVSVKVTATLGSSVEGAIVLILPPR